jgi:hypothetical protein
MTGTDRHFNMIVKPPRAQRRTETPEAPDSMSAEGIEKGVRVIDEASRDLRPSE